ncbi:MAG: hypothetical protein KJ957_08570 [Candidatus Omnitrophica bacterium]|nr:hypothetical protein [Candidatus Omnitrophota bacterium]
MNRVLILGDSTSMTVGFERKMYPFILADRKAWLEETEIVNCSQPGFTASDACAFFFRHVKDPISLKAVIIYLGNCDANATEIRKGGYTVFRQYYHKTRKLLGLKRTRRMLKNRLLRFEWNDTYDPGIERPERPLDYEYNISRIISYCRRIFVPVLLIRPIANLFFPAGVGKGNFMFYKYFGFQEKFSAQLTVPNTGNPECALVKKHNKAVSLAEDGRFEEAKKILLDLLKERNVRREIVLFNLAQIFKIQEDTENYRKTAIDAYESDSSLYRVKDSYVDAIDRIALKFQWDNLRIIDMGVFAKNAFFIDHCHLVPEGQELLAGKITEELTELKIMGGNKEARIKNILYNPELSFGDTTEFYRYYKTYAHHGNEQIKKDMDIVKKAYSFTRKSRDFEEALRPVSKEVKVAVEYYLTHPCFPCIQDILSFPPQYPCDIGRFPEFFLIRHIVPYLRISERENLLTCRFSSDRKLLRSSAELVSILPKEISALIPREDPHVDQDVESGRVDRILAKVKTDLCVHLRSGNQIYERMNTTIYWYFRESLRWGSHSRISMRYDRRFLEYSAEALAVATVADWKLGRKMEEELLKAIQWVDETDRIHSRFTEKFSLEKDCKRLLIEYDDRLLKLAEEIEKDRETQSMLCPEQKE